VLVAGAVGADRFAGRQPPLAPATTTSPATTSPAPTSTALIPAAVQRAIPLDVQVHLEPFSLSDRFGMASDVTGVMEDCDGGPAEIRAWAQMLGETWLLVAKEPLPGRNWICWSDGLFDKRGGSIFGGHGGSSDRLKLLQASQLSNAIAGKGELAVVGVPSPGTRCGCGSSSRTGGRSTSSRSTPSPSSRSGSTSASTSSR
jgi:hypothetical protein